MRSWLPFTLVLFLVGLAAARAQDVGPRVDYLIGSDAGGGYDRYARLIAKHMVKHLPGTEVVPINKPAGAGVPALNDMARGPADGSKMMTFNTGHLLSQFSDESRVDFDLATLSWIGKASSETRILVVRSDLDASTIDDLRREGEPFLFVTSGFGGSNYVQTLLLSDAFGLNIRILPGFSGGERRAALAKGEIDGYLTSESNLNRIVDGGFGRAILRFGHSDHPLLVDLPDALGLAETDIQSAIVDKIYLQSSLGRLTAAAPGTPDQILAKLRAAYDATMADLEFLTEAAELGVPVDPANGAEVEAQVHAFMTTSDDLRSLIEGAMRK